jgi:tripartite-type tricarboxylate transporter receptor subunit TctC
LPYDANSGRLRSTLVGNRPQAATAISDPAIQKRIAELGGVPLPMAPTEFGKLLADESEKWANVVKTAGISVE